VGREEAQRVPAGAMERAKQTLRGLQQAQTAMEITTSILVNAMLQRGGERRLKTVKSEWN
jgi:hypothetical protein